MVVQPTTTPEGLDLVREIQLKGRLLDKPNPVTIEVLSNLLWKEEKLAVLISKGKDPTKGMILSHEATLDFMEGQDANGFAFYAIPDED